MNAHSISVIIHTKNAEKTIEKAMNSVRSWVNEVLVIDMSSTDATVKLAKKLGAGVHIVADQGYADPARNEALKLAKSAWTLVLDADEEIPPTLAEYLQQIARNGGADAYFLPRKNMIFGKWAKTGWWPDYIIRFFRSGAVQWSPGVHGTPVTKGKTAYVPVQEELAILHHNYGSVEQFVDRMNVYTSLQAKEHAEEKPLLRAGADEFFRRFYKEKGHEQGVYGLALSFLQTMYMVTLEIKRWEKAGILDEKKSEALEKEMRMIGKHLRYWIADMHVHTSGSLVGKTYWRARRKFCL
ncbi:MAG: Glycosyl transferase family 2 [Microgenomates group bacterium GW2011_GWB1_45_17]|nr:MAG: Glycosyl transferase family 2 [Microgenomates group bacterium GW2011_GWB1_45_17]KKU24753.1 MAG: Glycosyl transferase family 2 [Microgenomates group bacterium GW2011_GWC1_46_15]